MLDLTNLDEIEAQELEGTQTLSTEEYLIVFNDLSEEEKLKRLKFFVKCMNFPPLDGKLKTVKDYQKFIYKTITESLPIDKVDKKEMNNWNDLRVGRLTVSSFKYLFSNLWQIESVQLLKCDNITIDDLLASIILKDVMLKPDGTPADAYIEFVLKAYVNKDLLEKRVKQFHTKFLDKAGYQYLCMVNKRLNRKQDSYIDYKDIRVCDFIYHKDFNNILVKIGMKPTYKPKEEDSMYVKRRK